MNSPKEGTMIYVITEVIEQHPFDKESPAPYASADYTDSNGDLHKLEVQPANLASLDILKSQFDQQLTKIEDEINSRKTIDPAILAELNK